jgi:hypothetical protein
MRGREARLAIQQRRHRRLLAGGAAPQRWRDVH